MECQDLGDIKEGELELDGAAQHAGGPAGAREREGGIAREGQAAGSVKRVDHEVEPPRARRGRVR